MGKKEEYQGKDIVIYFDRARCIHSRHCVLGQPKVFRANAKGAWIKPDSGSAELIAGVIRSCPSGALTYKRLEGGSDEAPPEVNVIRTLENGPLAVHADIRIDNEEPMFRATLCRCGASENKPFCDGSHKKINFTATGEPETVESKPLEKRNGTLHISPLKGGPFMAKGSVEICSGTGRTVTRTQETALCRCGASKNKPFCDGSHVRVGFTAD